MNESGRIRREKKTIDVMIRMYCRTHHGAPILCDECSGLLSYAPRKICYSRTMREDVRRVMRFSGPRMPAAHPLLSILHMLDPFRANVLSRA